LHLAAQTGIRDYLITFAKPDRLLSVESFHMNSNSLFNYSRLLAIAAFAVPRSAHAAPCPDFVNPVYVPGTSLVKPLFVRVANKLATAATPITILYQSKSTCTAYSQLTTGAPKMTGTVTYWDAGGEKTCDLPTEGVTPDVAFGDLTWKTCTAAEQPAEIRATQTYVQSVGFVVPITSTQTAITAEECNVLLSAGASPGKQLSPWNDPNFIVVRNPNSSTQWLNGLACGVPGNAYSANLTNTNAVSADVLAKVSAQNSTPNAEKTIGILASDYYDNVRDKVKMLAFQSYKQGCAGAFLPDSSATTFDKKNVRDGHYGTFGYTWAMTPLAAPGGAPRSATAGALVAFMAGTAKVNEADPIADGAKIGLVPQCAMSVKRSVDGGELQRFTPAESCGCYYESVNGTSTCATCSAASPCAGGKTCRFGYCEAK
jgi:hypothetical protein